jgi:hypothetical protein
MFTNVSRLTVERVHTSTATLQNKIMRFIISCKKNGESYSNPKVVAKKITTAVKKTAVIRMEIKAKEVSPVYFPHRCHPDGAGKEVHQ